MVFTDTERSQHVKQLIAQAQSLWNAKRSDDGYDQGSGIEDDSPKAGWHGQCNITDHFAGRRSSFLPASSATASRRQPKAHRCTRHVKPVARRRALGYGGSSPGSRIRRRTTPPTLRFLKRLRRSHHPRGSSRLTRPCSAQTPVEPRLRRHGVKPHHGLTIPRTPCYRAVSDLRNSRRRMSR